MPVLSKEKHNQLLRQLQLRYENLRCYFDSRELKSPGEGTKSGTWLHPDKMCSTEGNNVEISMAVEDFKTILTEIKKLK